MGRGFRPRPRRKCFRGDALRRVRERRGFSQADAGKVCGLTGVRMNGYETGRMEPTLRVFREMAEGLRLGFAEVFELLNIVPPGLSYREFRAFLRACRAENQTPAMVFAQFMKAYANVEEIRP
jgi:transcriptional regulator with XRE-family HTH domain